MTSSNPCVKTKVVIDTNVLVSAIVSKHGFSRKIIELLIEERFESITSPDIMKEMILVVNREEIRTRVNQKDTDYVLRTFIHVSTILTRTPKLPPFPQDPKDTIFFEAAIGGNADLIVSGDRDLVGVDQYQGVKIVTPRKLVERLLEEKEKNGESQQSF